MKKYLYHIIIKTKAGKTNEETFTETMETFMGEYPCVLWSDFKTWTGKENQLLGIWTKDVFSEYQNYCKTTTDVLFVEDESGNITEYFVLTENNTIKHEIIEG